jgi:3-dehydroquinate synthase
MSSFFDTANITTLITRLGAYHAPLHTFLDFSFLKTLPVGQVRNGFAELVKIASVGDKTVWDLLVKHGKDLVETGFGHKEGGDSVRKPGQEICERGIETMLELESPNLHELGLDRVIAFGHTWSPTLELTPKIPLRHGHAITVSFIRVFFHHLPSLTTRSTWLTPSLLLTLEA